MRILDWPEAALSGRSCRVTRHRGARSGRVDGLLADGVDGLLAGGVDGLLAGGRREDTDCQTVGQRETLRITRRKLACGVWSRCVPANTTPDTEPPTPTSKRRVDPSAVGRGSPRYDHSLLMSYSPLVSQNGSAHNKFYTQLKEYYNRNNKVVSDSLPVDF